MSWASASAGVDVMGVVGADQGETGAAGDLQEPLADRGLLGHAVVLELQEVVVGPEDLRVLAGHPLGRVEVAAQDGLGKLAADTPGEADQPLAVSGEQLLVDPRLVVVALEVGDGRERDQVGVAGGVAGQQHQVVGVAVGAPLLVAVGARRHVHLAADDRLDPGGDRLGVELHGSVEDAVVGDRHRRLAHRLRAAPPAPGSARPRPAARTRCGCGDGRRLPLPPPPWAPSPPPSPPPASGGVLASEHTYVSTAGGRSPARLAPF